MLVAVIRVKIQFKVMICTYTVHSVLRWHSFLNDFQAYSVVSVERDIVCRHVKGFNWEH